MRLRTEGKKKTFPPFRLPGFSTTKDRRGVPLSFVSHEFYRLYVFYLTTVIFCFNFFDLSPFESVAVTVIVFFPALG